MWSVLPNPRVTTTRRFESQLHRHNSHYSSDGTSGARLCAPSERDRLCRTTLRRSRGAVKALRSFDYRAAVTELRERTCPRGWPENECHWNLLRAGWLSYRLLALTNPRPRCLTWRRPPDCLARRFAAVCRRWWSSDLHKARVAS